MDFWYLLFHRSSATDVIFTSRFRVKIDIVNENTLSIVIFPRYLKYGETKSG